MNDNTTNMSKLLADTLRAKATSLLTSDITPLNWGKAYVPHFFFRAGCQFHTDLSDVFHNLTAKRGQKVLILAPRGNAKSTVASMLAPLKAICEATEKYIILLADTTPQAESYLKTIADELDYNEDLRKKYPLACKHGDVWNAGRIETASGTCIEALGKGKSLRGRKFRQWRPTLIILDDPQNDEDVMSPSTREKDVNWFDRTLIPAGDTDTNYLVVGTNLHRESIVNTLTTRSDFKVMRYASIQEWPTNMELWEQWEILYHSGKDALAYYQENKAMMDAGATVLWPEKESLLDLMLLRANIGHIAFATEKQNDPRDASKCEFDEGWFDDDVWYDNIPKGVQLVTVGYCDPAKGGESKRRDYSANILLHFCPSNNCCYITADISRRPVNVLIDNINNLCVVHRPIVFGIEANGFQELIVDEATAKYPLLPIQPIQNYGIHKNTRISRLSIWFQRKFFRFKRGCKHTKLLYQMLLDHPKALHDDGPDALEGALRVLTSVSSLDTSAPEMPAEDHLGDNIFEGNAFI